MVDKKSEPFLMTDEEEEFARLFAESGQQSAGPKLQRGDAIQGRIISIGAEHAFVDLGGKAEGSIDASELVGEGFSVGDTLEAIVVSTTDGVHLSRTLAGAGRDAEALASAFEAHLPVEGRIEGRNKGGFDVTIGGHRAFLPVSHLDLGSVPEEQLEAWIGTTQRFLIIEHDPRGRRLVVSRVQLLREEREQKAAELWDSLKVGEKVIGTVRTIQDYGAFIDIGGADGLLHVREMSWGRVGSPRDLLSEGQDVEVTVTEVDRERKRIGLSMKSPEGDPWSRLGTDVSIGDVVEGQVTRLMAYGAFVEILPGVEGLVHISEMTHQRHLRHPRDMVSEGEQVTVTLLDIDPHNRRVSLSMKQVEGDPWDDVEETYPPGTVLTGTVERIAPFGVFITVAPGVTALLPGSETEHRGQGDLTRFYKPGDLVKAKVLTVDADNERMSLSTRAVGEAEEKQDAKDWQAGQKPKGGAGLGTFADLLKDVKLK